MTRRRIAALLLALGLAAPVLRAAPQACVDFTPAVLSDGFCVLGVFQPGLITTATYWTEPPTNWRTRWTYQADGLCEASARLNGVPDDLPCIALLSPATLGRKAWLFDADHGAWLAVRVGDVAQREHMRYHALDTHSGGELSGALADYFGDKTWVNADGTRYRWLAICIVEAEPGQQCSAQPDLDFEAWFRSIMQLERP